MRKFSYIVVLALAFSFLGCNEAGTNSNNNAQIRENAQPVADEMVAVIELENQAAYGTITIELYSNIAPKMVERFKELAKAGVYDGVTFHRVNPSVIQTGDPLSKDDDPENDGTGKSDKPNVPAEFSDIEFDTGIVGAARGQDFDSANSQFFITLKREPGFDRRYTIFGKVIDGMVNARTIGGAPRDGETLIDPVRIKTVRIERKQVSN